MSRFQTKNRSGYTWNLSRIELVDYMLILDSIQESDLFCRNYVIDAMHLFFYLMTSKVLLAEWSCMSTSSQRLWFPFSLVALYKMIPTLELACLLVPWPSRHYFV